MGGSVPEGSDCTTLGNGNPIGPLQFDRLEVAPTAPRVSLEGSPKI
jgi:hypothetical protein